MRDGVTTTEKTAKIGNGDRRRHRCHEVIHIGRTQLTGRGAEAMEHFMKVNGCTQSEFHEALGEANREYLRRNEAEGWVTDISWLKKNSASNFPLSGKRSSKTIGAGKRSGNRLQAVG